MANPEFLLLAGGKAMSLQIGRCGNAIETLIQMLKTRSEVVKKQASFCLATLGSEGRCILFPWREVAVLEF